MKRLIAPATMPLGVDEVKEHLRVEGTDEDDKISAFILAAVDHVEEYTRRALIEQTWELVLHEFPSRDYIAIPRPPLIGVEAFEYTEAEASEPTDFSEYAADYDRNRVVLNYGESWPAVTLDPVAGIRIEFVSGYFDESASPAGENVPDAIKQALLLLVAHWYENREPVIVGTISADLPLTVRALLGPYRVVEMP